MIHAVILAGGWGKRLWPKSRRRSPKQILRLAGQYSSLSDLFNKINSFIPQKRIWVVTNKAYARSLRRHLPGLPGRNILAEPFAKNTAAAIGWASLIIQQTDPQAVTVVLSSDQIWDKKSALWQTIKTACRKAQKADVLVTVGIRPSRAATEYGYIKIAQSPKRKAHHKRIYKVEQFIEKPDIKRAKAYFMSNRYFWNSGIFVWKAASILQEIKKHLPKLFSGLEKIERAKGESGYQSRLASEYQSFRDISIDYGILERARNLYTIIANFSWQDLGSWGGFSCGSWAQDKYGNIVQGLHKGIDTYNSIIFTENKHLIGTLGVRDLIIVHSPTATLICQKERAQDVKQLTKVLEKDKYLRKYL